MRNINEHLAALAATLWVGTLWAIGFVAAPVLFHTLDDKMLAGAVAGRMFTVSAWIGLFCGGYLLLHRVASQGLAAVRQRWFWIVFLMLALTLAGHFGIAPILARLKQEALPHEVMQSVFANRFATWHGISSVLFVIQATLGVFLVTAGRSGGQGKTSRGASAGR